MLHLFAGNGLWSERTDIIAVSDWPYLLGSNSLLHTVSIVHHICITVREKLMMMIIYCSITTTYYTQLLITHHNAHWNILCYVKHICVSHYAAGKRTILRVKWHKAKDKDKTKAS